MRIGRCSRLLVRCMYAERLSANSSLSHYNERTRRVLLWLPYLDSILYHILQDVDAGDFTHVLEPVPFHR